MDGRIVTIALVVAMAAIIFILALVRWGIQNSVLLLIPLLWTANNIAIDRLQRWCKRNERAWGAWKYFTPNVVGTLYALCMFAAFYSPDWQPADLVGHLLLYLSFGCIIAGVPVAFETDKREIEIKGKSKIDWLLLLPPLIMSLISFSLLVIPRFGTLP
ncbi:MAG: hypothetical protein F4X81_11210 [Gammaproteobacteria bacterium]|nr:hypothetical protein [Gammaproteobacteria bacterium]MYE52023.1 hypothetical protein [Gammaproteobacteria bacterium]